MLFRSVNITIIEIKVSKYCLEFLLVAFEANSIAFTLSSPDLVLNNVHKLLYISNPLLFNKWIALPTDP